MMSHARAGAVLICYASTNAVQAGVVRERERERERGDRM